MTNFQCRGVLIIWILVGKGSIALAVVSFGGCLDIFLSSVFSLPLWKTDRYRMKCCLKGSLYPKQPTNYHVSSADLMAKSTDTNEKQTQLCSYLLKSQMRYDVN